MNYEYFGDSIDIAFKVLGEKAKIELTDYENYYEDNYEDEFNSEYKDEILKVLDSKYKVNKTLAKIIKNFFNLFIMTSFYI